MTDIVQQGRLIADWVRGLGFAAYADDIEALAAVVERQENAIRWACGELGDFGPEPPPLAGKYRRRFWWRKELRERAGLAAEAAREAADA